MKMSREVIISFFILGACSGCVHSTSKESNEHANLEMSSEPAGGAPAMAGEPVTGGEPVAGGEGGVSCVAELCDGQDNDCDGQVDEAACPGVCGDMILDPDEACDYGAANTTAPCPYGDPSCDRCTTECERAPISYCGDGVINGPEGCEEDQPDEGRLCTLECTLFECGATLDYMPMRIQGWPVCVATQLMTQDPTLAQDVIDALDEDLDYIKLVLPSEASEWLQRVNIWVEFNEPAFPGGVYHPNPTWLTENGYPSEWALGIQLGVPQNYMTWVQEQPAIILHELTHAWHHQRLGYEYAPITNAYNAAMEAGIYDSVQYVYGQYLPAYAKNNAAEYFAELTEAMFWTNDYYPFNLTELQAHDPVGAAVVEAAWSLD